MNDAPGMQTVGSATLAPERPVTIPAPPATPGFQALLERLQKLASSAPAAAPVTSADELREAVRAADSSFTTAMDLRRQLEEAFRRHVP
jgi:hypothetical protein